MSWKQIINKESNIKEVWDSISDAQKDYTYEDFCRLSDRISQDSLKKRQRYKFFNVSFSIASVAILILGIFLFIDNQDSGGSTIHEVTDYGEKKQITLPDGSIAYLDAGSTLIYPDQFRGSIRNVFLTGQAVFNVASNPQKPFIVETKEFKIEALGTTFNVNAYLSDKENAISLLEGRIRVDFLNSDNASQILNKDMKIILNKDDDTISVISTNTRNDKMWSDGFLIFENESLQCILQSLERKFNVKIFIDQKYLSDKTYYLTLEPDDTLDIALDIICSLLGEKTSYRSENGYINIF